ncbi:MAG: hypothetical protein KF716_14645 [Anaerolineae bacterium]|nr:hypothetical protein [Anaerolineae bacterium]
MAANIVNSVTTGIGELFQYLADIQEDLDEARSLINLMGWELPPGLEDIGLASINLGAFLEKLEAVLDAPSDELEDELAMLTRIGELTTALVTLVQEIRTLATTLPTKLASFGDYVDRTNIHNELPKRLFDFFVANYVSRTYPLTYAILHLINFFDYPYFPADPAKFQVEHVRTVINYDVFKKLFDDPAQLATEAYGWNTPAFDPMRLLQRITLLFQALGLRSRIQPLDREIEQIWLNQIVTDPETMPQLVTFLFEELGTIAGFRLGLSLFGVRPSTAGGSDGGLGVVPIVRGQGIASIPFFRFDDTFLDLAADVEVLKRVALLMRPNKDLETRLANGLTGVIAGRIGMAIRHGKPDGDLKTIVAFPGGSSFQMQQFYLMGGMERQPDRPNNSFMELGVLGGRFKFSMDGADSFLQENVPSKNVETKFDLKVRWSKEQGLHFEGSSALALTTPVHTEIGPFTLSSVTLAFSAQGGGLGLQSSVAGSLSLGPLVATVQGIGLGVDVTFESGNLGILGVSPHFKPPDGIGLVVDGGGFKGGGFLRFIEAEKRYEGVLELEYQDKIALKALALLTTKLPDGSSGFSLLIIISAEFTPVQLGLGFTLNGVGGLLGLNRTANVDRLRTGLRDATLNSVLFPQNVVANADRILSDLNQVFPPKSGRFLFGPMAKIGWGTPTLLTIDLGLLIEIPDPIRVLILGVVRAKLPDENFKLLQLQVNFMGEIDFEAQRFSFDASLFDSKLLSFTLSGDMAVRICWGADPNFLLSVGGFHPSYQPPPLNLPTLRRLSLQLTEGDNPRLTLECYFAITSNTVQFGAKIELLAKAGSFSVYGFLSFDVLFQFNPFYFIASISAKLVLRAGSSEIASISLDLTLEGPTPWHVKGTAKLKICWFLTIKVHFDKTFGEQRNTQLGGVSVLPLLKTALQDQGNWEAQLPTGRHLLTTFKEIQKAPEEIVVYPFGVLTIQQKVVPLNIEVKRFGSQQPTDGNQFAIQQVLAGEGSDAEALTTAATREMFAPAQFFELSDAEKLARKSFEQYDSGVRLIDSEAFDGEYAVRREVKYELFYVDDQRNLVPQQQQHTPDFHAFDHWALRGSIANSPLSFANTGKSNLAPQTVTMNQEQFVVVTANTLQPVDGGTLAASEQSAHSLMAAMIRANPALDGEILVLPSFEVNGL